MRVLIAGGGTGGHVFPAIAVAEELQRRSADPQIRFVGAEGGLEQRMVPAAGFSLDTLRVGKLKGASLRARLHTLAGLPSAILAARRIINEFRPEIVVGVGGYASGPVALAAYLSHVPIVLLEQNAIPGMTNRKLSRLAKKVVISFANSARYFPSPQKTVHLGNPIRRALRDAIAGSRREFDPNAPSLLVLGGSQGAKRVNELITNAAEAIFGSLPGLRLLHQTGDRDHRWVSQRYASIDGANALPFIDDVATAYAEADLFVGRAGATTVAELGVAGCPAILIPYPFAADDHQAKNAEAPVEAGAALLRRQGSLEAPALARSIVAILGNAERQQRMRSAMRRCGHPGAAEAVVDLLHEIATTYPAKTA